MKKIQNIIATLLVLGISNYSNEIQMGLWMQKAAIQPQAIVVQGWLKMNRIQFKTAEIFLGRNINFGNNEENIQGGLLKLVRNKNSLHIQFTTTDVSCALQQYRFWQQFANYHSHKEKMGITIILPAYNNITEHMWLEWAKQLQPKGIISAEEDETYYTAIGHSDFWGEGITIAGERINWNLVCNKNTRQIYFATPIIYQTY